MRKEQREQGVPPNWMVYISVENADQSAQKAAQAGGTILAPPFDVMEEGRMAVLQDPTGAIFSLWQPKRTQGVGIAASDNTFCWADLNTVDPERAAEFYSQVFGWKLTKGEHDPSGYLHIQNGDGFIGGVPPAGRPNPQTPPHWLIYFQVGDVSVTAAKASQLGGKVYMPPRTIENVGDMAVVADPQGAVFALFKSARNS
jgi:predicted enzyme related to lactoylglutathione lyase